MYPITNEVKALFEAEQVKVLRITGTDSNSTAISITDDDVIADSFQIDRYCCNGEKLEIGTAVAAQLSMTLENGDGRYDSIVFEGTELFAEVGIADWSQSSPTVTYIPCGYFTPDIQPRKMSTISLKCLDRMTKFDVLVDAADLTLPATVAGLVGQMCTLRGVTLGTTLTSLPNYNYSISALPEVQGAVTYRMLLQWCAGMMGTNAYIDWNGKLCFAWYDNTTGYVSTIDNRYSSDLYENAITITGVQFVDSDDDRTVYLAGTDAYALDVSDNALINATNAATVLSAIYNAVGNYAYTPFSASVIAAPYLWPMDRMTFTDKDGNGHVSLLTNVNFGLNGVTQLAALGQTAQVNSTAAPSSFTAQQLQALNRIQRITTSAIQNAVDEATAQITGADGGYVRFMYDASGNMTEILIMDTDDITTATKVWRWNQGGLGYSSNGYAGPYTTAITQNGAIVANFITSGTLDASLANIINLNANNITAGTLSADRIRLNSYNPDFLIPNENDPSTLFSGQSISNGWIVQTGGDIDVVKIPNAEKYRGQTIEISATTVNLVQGGNINWFTENDPGQLLPDENTASWTAPTYGQVSSDGTLTGATNTGSYYKYTRQFTIPNDAVEAYVVTFTCSGIRAITVSTGVSSELGLRYAQNIGLDNTGLQVGKFVVNRSGDATFNGDAVFNGNVTGLPTGVKGNAESTYRTGNVNLTPANIGALPLSGGTITGTLQVNNTSTTGGGIKIWEDTEGGNFSIYSPSGVEYQFDAFNNDTIRCHVFGSDNTWRNFSFNRNTGKLSASGGFNGNATNVTGTVAIGNGGTGQTGTSSVVTTISDVAVANTADGFSITEAKYAYWGKVAMVRLKVKKTGAVTSATQMTLCTVVSGKRPVVPASATCVGLNITYSEIATNGQLLAYGTWGNESGKIFHATYILT